MVGEGFADTADAIEQPHWIILNQSQKAEIAYEVIFCRVA